MKKLYMILIEINAVISAPCKTYGLLEKSYQRKIFPYTCIFAHTMKRQNPPVRQIICICIYQKLYKKRVQD